MTINELLPHLDGVQQRGTRWAARCPAHADRSPSLSISEGEKGLLVRCWAGCSVPEICESLGLQQKDLFFDALDASPTTRRAAARARERQHKRKTTEAQQQGACIDALREADFLIRSRRDLDINGWSNQKLDDELNCLAEAYALLEKENLDGQLG